MTPAEQLLADARAAERSGQNNWREHHAAVALYRQKNWTWQMIWARMAALGLVVLEDKRALKSFRSSMLQWEQRQKKEVQP